MFPSDPHPDINSGPPNPAPLGIPSSFRSPIFDSAEIAGRFGPMENFRGEMRRRVKNLSGSPFLIPLTADFLHLGAHLGSHAKESLLWLRQKTFLFAGKMF